MRGFFASGSVWLEAKRIFRRFLKKSLGDYDANRNQPQTDYVSHMSKYLHFGHVSPIWLALQAKDASGGKNTDSFLEELIVRRELTFQRLHAENAGVGALERIEHGRGRRPHRPRRHRFDEDEVGLRGPIDERAMEAVGDDPAGGIGDQGDPFAWLNGEAGLHRIARAGQEIGERELGIHRLLL